MKMILLAEGATEKIAVAGFLKGWLDSRLKRQKVRIEPVDTGGWGNFERDVVKRARAHLDGPDRREIIAVFKSSILRLPRGNARTSRQCSTKC